MTCCTTLYTVLIPPPPSITVMNLLIVLRNDIGYTMTVFYDAISESITGYGLDPSNPDVYRPETFLFGGNRLSRSLRLRRLTPSTLKNLKANTRPPKFCNFLQFAGDFLRLFRYS